MKVAITPGSMLKTFLSRSRHHAGHHGREGTPVAELLHLLVRDHDEDHNLVNFTPFLSTLVTDTQC